MPDRKFTVYAHKFPNGKYYIGLTSQNPKYRWGKNGNRYCNQYVYKFIQQYGWDNIEHIIIKDHLTLEEACELEKQKIKEFDSYHNGYNCTIGGEFEGGKAYLYNYKGELYTVFELAEMNGTGITPHGLHTRIMRGYSIEEAVEKPLVYKKLTWEYKGVYYTVDELYDKFAIKSITRQDLVLRLNSKWDIERALTQPRGVKKQPFGIVEKTYEYNGKMYNTYELSQIHPELHLTSTDIGCRINKHKWSIERAITQPKRRSHITFTYNDKEYSPSELIEICADKTMTVQDVLAKDRNGWTVDEIVNIPKWITRKQYHKNN